MNTKFSPQFDRELADIINRESRLASFIAARPRKPLTPWQRILRGVRLFLGRVSDAWDVLLGRAEVGSD